MVQRRVALPLGGDFDPQLVQLRGQFGFLGAQDFELGLRFGAARLQVLDAAGALPGISRFQAARARSAASRWRASILPARRRNSAACVRSPSRSRSSMASCVPERGNRDGRVLPFPRGLHRAAPARLRSSARSPRGARSSFVDCSRIRVDFGIRAIDLIFPLEQRIGRLRRGAAVQHAVAGENFAVQRDDRRAALRENAQRRFDVRHQRRVIDEPLDQARAPRACAIDLVDQPINPAFRELQRASLLHVLEDADPISRKASDALPIFFWASVLIIASATIVSFITIV